MNTHESFNVRDYNWSGKKILVVEDDLPSFIYLKALLGMTGVETFHVQTGAEAISYCQENDVDLILMDIQLPGISGYEATKEIKVFKPDLPVIAQTAFAIIGEKEKSIEAGCDDYITKPINKVKLIQMLETFLGK